MANQPFHQHGQKYENLSLHRLNVGAGSPWAGLGDTPYSRRVGFPPALTAPVQPAAAQAKRGLHPLAQPGRWLQPGDYSSSS